MGLLTGEFTEQDEVLNQSKTTQPKTYKPSLAVDVGSSLIYGAEKGLFNLVNAGTRPFIGDEAADKGLANIDRQIKPTNQGTAGHVTSGISEVLTTAAVTAPLGGTPAAATAVGLGTRAAEHTRLTQDHGVGEDTADTVSNLGGAAMAALTFVPMANVFRSGLVDYAVTVGGTTAAGQALTYGQGEILESKGYDKIGQQYKDMATDPTMIATNLVIGSAFWKLSRLKNDPNATAEQLKEAEAQTYEAVDQAIAEADKTSIPTKPDTAGDMLQHQDNINSTIDQIMKGERVNIAEATGGQLKSMDEVRNYIKNQNKTKNTATNTTINTPKESVKPFTAQGTQKRIYDEALSKGLSDADARTVVAMAHFESGGTFDTKIKNPKSNAAGIFQFIPSTWKQEGGTTANRYDLDTQIKLGIQHQINNINYIKQKTGHTLTGNEIYIPHLLGRGGAEAVFRELKANPNKPAVDVIRQFSKQPHKLMRINAIPKDATISQAVNFFKTKIDDITAKHYGGSGSKEAQQYTDIAEAAVPVKDYSSLDSSIHRTDLDTFPDLDSNFLSALDADIYIASHKPYDPDKPIGNFTVEQLDFPNMVLDKDGNLVPDLPSPEGTKITPESNEALYKLLEELEKVTELKASVPHTAKGIKVKDDLNNPAKEFKPDESIAVEWKERQRYEDGKYHKELTRSFKDKDGNTVQELKYRGTTLARTVNHAGKTDFIHVGRLNKSDFVNHKGNKELETALNRIFDTNNYGYLSQIPKGQETIAKLEANPDLVISSKKTGEDLTSAQWKDKLQREQDNITMMAKAMSTLAKCALTKAA